VKAAQIAAVFERTTRCVRDILLIPAATPKPLAPEGQEAVGEQFRKPGIVRASGVVGVIPLPIRGLRERLAARFLTRQAGLPSEPPQLQ